MDSHHGITGKTGTAKPTSPQLLHVSRLPPGHAYQRTKKLITRLDLSLSPLARAMLIFSVTFPLLLSRQSKTLQQQTHQAAFPRKRSAPFPQELDKTDAEKSKIAQIHRGCYRCHNIFIVPRILNTYLCVFTHTSAHQQASASVRTFVAGRADTLQHIQD